jgi:hypothetical protein
MNVQPRGLLSTYLKNDFRDLALHGFQVVPNAVHHADILAQDIQYDIDNIQYKTKNFTLLQQYGVGQWESVCKSRISTIPIWKKLYQTDSLLSSWDGLSHVTQEEQIEYAKRLNEFGEPNWIHRDQCCSNENLADTIQGMLALSDANEFSYSTVLYTPRNESAQSMLDRYHNHFHRYQNKYGRVIKKVIPYEDDYYLFLEDELDWIRKNCIFTKPILKKGDLLLWCSAIPHAACPAKTIQDLSTLNTRLATFISMVPKHLANSVILSERREMFKTGLTSSHNVFFPKLFPFSSHNEQIKKKQLSDHVNEIQKSLVG